MPVTPWAADSLTHVRDSVVIQPIYEVRLYQEFVATPAPAGMVPPDAFAIVPAWNVEVTLDGSRAPYGTAKFSAPVDYIGTAAIDPRSLFIPLEKLNPYFSRLVTISAGYQRSGGPDLQRIFTGFITGRRLRKSSAGTAYVEFTAETAETMLDFPSNRAGNVDNAWTSIKEACDTINAYATPWYRQVSIIEESGQMNTPTAAQLTGWRAWQYQEGDNVMDTLIAWATALGQWVRGHPRYNAAFGNPLLLVSAAPDPYRAATTLPETMFTELERVEDVNQWANILNLSVAWTDPSSKDTKQKRATYTTASVDGAGNAGKQLRAKDVSIRVYPPSGALPASYPLAGQWLKRISARQEAKWTGTSRAMYWLQPRIDGVLLSSGGLGDAAGPIETITFRLDDGTQTMTWTADAVYKP